MKISSSIRIRRFRKRVFARGKSAHVHLHGMSWVARRVYVWTPCTCLSTSVKSHRASLNVPPESSRIANGRVDFRPFNRSVRPTEISQRSFLTRARPLFVFRSQTNHYCRRRLTTIKIVCHSFDTVPYGHTAHGIALFSFIASRTNPYSNYSRHRHWRGRSAWQNQVSVVTVANVANSYWFRRKPGGQTALLSVPCKRQKPANRRNRMFSLCQQRRKTIVTFMYHSRTRVCVITNGRRESYFIFFRNIQRMV